MKPNAYFDIEIRGAASAGAGQIPALPVVTRLISLLHSIFRDHPGRFAMALPGMRTGENRHPGHVVRVFTENRDDLYLIQDALQQNERIHGYVLYGRHNDVPENFDGEWIEYRRYRIPGTRSRLEKCREYRIKHADSLPYVRLGSKSTGQAFSLYFELRPGEKTGDCEPDSYGLSIPTKRFCLPDIKPAARHHAPKN
ncbi:MAG: type I-F CRISPR-associated endoribonuclease Cas6/Csy4 [Rhodocyclaceae bacterium]|nr:type I-F CRISPR-associated endoribonuclease Cas6/Csy4 [Rhodocyclaceae bacterium]